MGFLRFAPVTKTRGSMKPHATGWSANIAYSNIRGAALPMIAKQYVLA